MKLKDLLNHMAGHSSIIAGIEIYYHLIPIDSELYPQCLRKPHDSEIWTRYGNDRVNSFAIVGNAFRVYVEHEGMDDPEKAPYTVRYATIHSGRAGTFKQEHTILCETERQLLHVIAYVTGRPDTHELIDPVRR